MLPQNGVFMLTIALCFLFATVYNITQNIQIIKKMRVRTCPHRIKIYAKACGYAK